MKKFTQFAVIAGLLFIMSSGAHAWDVYVYNKTAVTLGVNVLEMYWGQSAYTCQILNLSPGGNYKCTTKFFGMDCPYSVELSGADIEKPFTPYQEGVANKCTNTRVEITKDSTTKKYKATWYTQY